MGIPRLLRYLKNQSRILSTRYARSSHLKKQFVSDTGHMTLVLQLGDGLVLYTDGIPEARDINKVQYGVEKLCEVISENWQKSAQNIKDAVIADVRRHIGKQKVFDDITLLVLKRQDDVLPDSPRSQAALLSA